MYESTTQADVARNFAGVLAGLGYVISESEYDVRRTVVVHGADGPSLVVVPLHLFDEEEPFESGSDEWAYLVRDAAGEYVDTSEARRGQEPPFGCPSYWHLSFEGQRWLHAVEQVRATLDRLAQALGFRPLAGVRPHQTVAGYPETPYAGRRPDGSWVVDGRGHLLPVMADSFAPSGWSVVETGGRTECLDAWPAARDGRPVAQRVALLSYGSNACPTNLVANDVSLPGVNLACSVADLASVWAQGTRHRDHAVPATLAAIPGCREDHVVSYVVPHDLQALDAVEGRPSVYDLVRLTEGEVVRADGQMLDEVLAYIGVSPSDGRCVTRTATSSASPTRRRRVRAAACPQPAPRNGQSRSGSSPLRR